MPGIANLTSEAAAKFTDVVAVAALMRETGRARDAASRNVTAPFLRAGTGAAPGAARPDPATVTRLLTELARGLQLDEDTARSCVSEAMAALGRDSAPLPAAVPTVEPEKAYFRGGLAQWQIKAVTRHVEENLGDTVRTADMAGLVRLSNSYFSKAFKSSFGTSPYAYVMARRIERAKTLMTTTEMPLCQISLECGLADQSHLSRQFRRLVGQSPNSWRRARQVEA